MPGSEIRMGTTRESQRMGIYARLWSSLPFCTAKEFQGTVLNAMA